MTKQPDGMVTRALEAIRKGNPRAMDELLPLVHGELRKLARARMAHTPPGQTLQPTALVHEAYLRLVGDESARWENRAHFFAAAAQVMRNILVDQARRKAAAKRGGGRGHADVDEIDVPIEAPSEDILALDRALEALEKEDPRKAKIVMLRYFAGLSRVEAAETLGMSLRTLDREWRYIVARLHRDIVQDG